MRLFRQECLPGGHDVIGCLKAQVLLYQVQTFYLKQTEYRNMLNYELTVDSYGRSTSLNSLNVYNMCVYSYLFWLFLGTYFDIHAFVFVANIQTPCESDDELLVLQPVGELEDGEIILSNLSCDDGEGGPCQFESRSTNANVMWQRVPNELNEDGISDTSIFSGKPLPL